MLRCGPTKCIPRLLKKQLRCRVFCFLLQGMTQDWSRYDRANIKISRKTSVMVFKTLQYRTNFWIQQRSARNQHVLVMLATSVSERSVLCVRLELRIFPLTPETRKSKQNFNVSALPRCKALCVGHGYPSLKCSTVTPRPYLLQQPVAGQSGVAASSFIFASSEWRCVAAAESSLSSQDL